MTTVFGVKHPEVDSAILVADRQTTMTDCRTGFPAGKHLGRKLWTGKGNLYCVGHSGLIDKETEDFVGNLTEGKYNIEKIIEEKNFTELRELNIKRMGRNVPELDKLSSFLLLTRFDNKPKLYTCFPLGNVEERVWTAIGSGFPKIREYMDALTILSEAKNYINYKRNPISTRDIVRVGLEAVRRSQNQDIYSSGLDLLVCTPNGIDDHFTELQDDFGKKLKKIQRKY